MRRREACGVAINRVLVPLDGSELSETALPIARMLATQDGAQLHLLAVSGERHPGSTRDWYAYLQEVAAAEREMGMVVRTSVRAGDAVTTILMLAREIQADLIVMATHGRTGWDRTLLGSVANQVLRESSVPVIVLRPGQPAAPLTTADRSST